MNRSTVAIALAVCAAGLALLSFMVPKGSGVSVRIYENEGGEYSLTVKPYELPKGSLADPTIWEPVVSITDVLKNYDNPTCTPEAPLPIEGEANCLWHVPDADFMLWDGEQGESIEDILQRYNDVNFYSIAPPSPTHNRSTLSFYSKRPKKHTRMIGLYDIYYDILPPPYFGITRHPAYWASIR